MILEVSSGVVSLDYRAILPIEGALGAHVQCTSGCIWITEERASEDVVLEAGKAYEIRHNGVVLIQALRAATVVLQTRARTPHLRELSIATQMAALSGA